MKDQRIKNKLIDKINNDIITLTNEKLVEYDE